MKRFLLALSFALLVPACVGELGDAAEPTAAVPSDDTAVPPPSSARVEGGALPATSCFTSCQTQYSACLDRSQGDPLSDCLCYNHLQLCNISCGGHGFPRNC